jgi:hypothetical protein
MQRTNTNPVRGNRISRLIVGAGAALLCASASVASAAVWDSRSSSNLSLFSTSVKSTSEDRLSHAFSQFGEWANWVEVILGILLAVGLATLLAYHPRSSSKRDQVEAAEERKLLVLLGLIGAVVSALVAIDQSMALVIFGIGGLIRFRTVVGSAHLTARAILVVVIGLAAGLSQFVTAIVVAAAAWIVIWWLHAHRAARLKVRLPLHADRQRAEAAATAALSRMHCRVQSIKQGDSGRTFTLTLQVPSAVHDDLLAKGLAGTMSAEFGAVEVEIQDE